MFNQWISIEPTSSSLTQLAKEISSPIVTVKQIYNLAEDELLNNPQAKVFGIVLSYKWSKLMEKKDHLANYDNDLFFARQIVNNCSPTLALLSVLLNADTPKDIDLINFQNVTKDLSCEERGLALSNFEGIRKRHNSISNNNDNTEQGYEQYQHFVSYVLHKDNIYELDGLQSGPILIGKADEGNWLNEVKQLLERRLKQFSVNDIEFNLMVVCEDIVNKIQNQIAELQAEKMGCDSQQNGDKIEAKINYKRQQVRNYKMKDQKRQKQNYLRKFDYNSVYIHILKKLAEKKRLSQLIQKTAKM